MGIPEASGCALGVERLLMTFTGAEDIGRVLFP
jgi:elongation factor P--beta-lysine ligase